MVMVTECRFLTRSRASFTIQDERVNSTLARQRYNDHRQSASWLSAVCAVGGDSGARSTREGARYSATTERSDICKTNHI
jgi:hypothetical protein